MIATRNRDQAQLRLISTQANPGRYDRSRQSDWRPRNCSHAKAQVAQLESAIKADDALIEASKIQLEYTRLTSPISGITGIRQVDARQHHPSDRSERSRRRHADRADLGDLHAA